MRGRRGARGGGRPGPRRRHRARSLPLPVPRRAGVPPRDRARLPAPRRRARARSADRRSARSTTWRRSPATPSVGHATAYCAGARGARRLPRAGARRRRCAASRSSSSGSPTTPAISARWRATSATCPTASYCGRLRGDFLNLTALVCGSRFGRGWSARAASAFDVDAARAGAIVERLGPTMRDVVGARELLRRPLRRARAIRGDRHARARGVPGPRDRRPGGTRLRARARRAPRVPDRHLPLRADLRSPPGHTGDVFARALRALAGDPALRELRGAISCATLPDGPTRAEVGALAPASITVSARRGLARRDLPRGDHGRRRALRAPTRSSILRSTTGSGWPWRCATRQISDFPLCNKSFNLSYCGHDL